MFAKKIQTGFTLVEIMVALVIGMLGVIVMMQTFALFESQKRTTTGGDDAISNGAVILHGLVRDLQQSGWGTSTLNIIGCTVTGVAKGNHAIPLAPVSINHALVPAGDANTDTLLVVSGNSNGIVEGVQIDTVSGSSFTVDASAAFVPPKPSTENSGDWVVAGPLERLAGSCALNAVRVRSIARPYGLTVSADPKYVLKGVSRTPQGRDKLFQLGEKPVIRAYAIRNQKLMVCDWTLLDCRVSGSWWPIADNIVSMRAQYGRDTATGHMDGIIDRWDQTVPSPTSGPVSTVARKNTEACALKRISAVRIALVARSSQPERRPADGSVVTAEMPRWAGSQCASGAGNAGCVAQNPDPGASITLTVTGGADWPTWQDYRYKVFQTIVPLRNVLPQDLLQGGDAENNEC